MSVKYCLPLPVFYFWRKLYRTLQRGLSAIAEHLVHYAKVYASQPRDQRLCIFGLYGAIQMLLLLSVS